jgi:hypothetical protein
VSASQLKDLFRQIDDRSINGRILQAFLEHQNPWELRTEFIVTSDGRNGEQFVADFMKERYNVSESATELLRDKAFVATSGVTYKLVVIMGDEFEDDQRTNQNIWAEGERRGYLKPTVEQAALLREAISDEEIERMRLWAFIVMHEPIMDSNGRPHLFGGHRSRDGRWLFVYDGSPTRKWDRGAGFVFLVPSV